VLGSCKKKIGGPSLDEDLRRIDSILSVLQDGQKLTVDANCRSDLRIQAVDATH
jgi:L-alanine-DL-glutamate epimerase-like enolase superfamily enzyme